MGLMDEFNKLTNSQSEATAPPLPRKTPGQAILMDPTTGELRMGEPNQETQNLAIQQIAARGFGGGLKVK